MIQKEILPSEIASTLTSLMRCLARWPMPVIPELKNEQRQEGPKPVLAGEL